MGDYLVGRVVLLVLVVGISLASCGCRYDKSCEIAGLRVQSQSRQAVVMPDYARGPLEVTGGLKAWTRTERIELDAVVTVCEPEGTVYLTEVYFDVYPWLSMIRILAREPEGKVVCYLSPHRFGVIDGDSSLYFLPSGLCGHCFARMMLDVITIPVRLLDNEFEFKTSSQTVKVEGLWYSCLERVDRGLGSPKPYSSSLFYQSLDRPYLDMILYLGAGGQDSAILVRAYDYRKIGQTEILVPAKLEVFAANKVAVVSRRLLMVDFK